jgi:hypothetical protein
MDRKGWASVQPFPLIILISRMIMDESFSYLVLEFLQPHDHIKKR